MIEVFTLRSLKTNIKLNPEQAKQEIKKIRAERHEIEYRKTRKKFNEKCQWFI